jgi:hypothetical protein
MYKKILQDVKKSHAEKIRQIEWHIKLIETNEQAAEDYKQNPENIDLPITEKIQLNKEIDHAVEDQTSGNENSPDLTDAERKHGLNDPDVYKPFLTHLKDLRRPPEAAKPVTRTEYHINTDDDVDNDKDNDDNDYDDSNEL